MCFQRSACPKTAVWRRGLLLALFFALLLAPAYHAMHRLAHGVVLDHWHAGHIDHEDHDGGHEHEPGPGSPPQPAAHAWLHAFFDGHDDGDCPLLDCLHAPGAVHAPGGALLPAPGPQTAAPAAALRVRFRRVAVFFDARAPPALLACCMV